MALFYEDIVEFSRAVTAKIATSNWPSSSREWKAMTGAEENRVRDEFDKMLCKLGRHDYEFGRMVDGEHCRLRCFYCDEETKTVVVRKGSE